MRRLKLLKIISKTITTLGSGQGNGIVFLMETIDLHRSEYIYKYRVSLDLKENIHCKTAI